MYKTQHNNANAISQSVTRSRCARANSPIADVVCTPRTSGRRRRRRVVCHARAHIGTPLTCAHHCVRRTHTHTAQRICAGFWAVWWAVPFCVCVCVPREAHAQKLNGRQRGARARTTHPKKWAANNLMVGAVYQGSRSARAPRRTVITAGAQKGFPMHTHTAQYSLCPSQRRATSPGL